MSRYIEFDTKTIKDLETLLAALAECGYSQGKVEVHEQPVTLLDYVGYERAEKANVVIRRKYTGIGASNDIGFVRQADGSYKAIVSEYDTRSLFIQQKPFVQAVTEAYGRLNGQRSLRTLLTRTIPGLKLSGKIPAHATIVQQTVGQTTKVSVRY